MSRQPRFKVALVGAGHISEFHAAAIGRVQDAKLIAIVDVARERAEQSAARLGVERVASSLQELKDSGVNVVHVVTPPSSHFDLTMQALELGCHVLVEKPLACSVEECNAIREKSAAVDRRICVNHSNLRDPFISRTLQLVKSGHVGRVLSVTYLRSSNYPPYGGGKLPPHYREGGYPFRDLGVHALYLFHELLGDIVDVNAVFEHRGDDGNLHFDEWGGSVQCAQGIGHFQLSWNARPLANILIVQGAKGTVRCDPFSMFVTLRRTSRLPGFIQRITGSLREGFGILSQVPLNLARVAFGRLRRYHGVQDTIEDFYRSLRDNLPVPVSVDDATPIVHWTEVIARKADQAKEATQSVYDVPKSAEVLVTGAAGYVGSHLTRELIKRHPKVRVLTRFPPPQSLVDDSRIEVCIGDLGDPDAVDQAAQGVRLVYHVGAAMRGPEYAFKSATEVGTRNVVQSVLKQTECKLVYISSLSVLDSSRARDTDVITEDWPLEPHPERRGNYTTYKLRAETIVSDAVRRQGLKAIIIRPGQIFGSGGNILTPAVARRIGRRLVVFGDGTIRLPLVHVDDLVDALLTGGEKGPFDGTVVHIVDDAESVDQNEVIQHLRPNRQGPQVIHVPRILLYALAGCVQTAFRFARRRAPLSIYRLRSAMSQMRFDCSRARSILCWEPNVGVRVGLAGCSRRDGEPLDAIDAGRDQNSAIVLPTSAYSTTASEV